MREHGLLQLRVHFVRNGNHVFEHIAEIHPVEIILKRIEDANLQDPRLFHHHRCGVALFAAQFAVLASRERDLRFSGSRKTQAINEISDQIRKMTGAVAKTQGDTNQFFVDLHEVHPGLNHRVQVIFQDGSHSFGGQRPSRDGVRQVPMKGFS